MSTAEDDVDAAFEPGDRVTYVDDDGDPHNAIVIDVFERPHDTGPWLNLVFNADVQAFGANTIAGLDDQTSVAHVDDRDASARYYEPGWQED